MKKRGEFVKLLSEKLINSLQPFCRRIQIAGSIRRNKENPRDIDIVLIPKDRIKFEETVKKIFDGKYLQGGEHESTWRIKGIKVEFYYTSKNDWGATLLAYSSTKGAGIGLRIIARSKGLKLNQHGLFDKNGKRIAGKTEHEIYHALGRKWKTPEKR